VKNYNKRSKEEINNRAGIGKFRNKKKINIK
jgi:hypothetical protein